MLRRENERDDVYLMVTFPGVDLTYDVRLSGELLLAHRFRDARAAQQSGSQRARVLFLGPSWALPLWQPMGFPTPLCDRDGVSEPGEMALESSKPVVILKFDMHIYTSTLTLEGLNHAIKEFCIPLDLHPRLPSLDLTMNKLPDDVIGIYVEQLDQGGMRIPFSTFLLVVIKYFRVHIS
ncbi:hypothetical protein Tco_0763481 [Tanacetum coccineum]